MGDFDERVKERAYRLWVEEGCPEGRAEVHWEKARELVAIEQNQKQTTKPVVRAPKGEPVEPAAPMKNLGEFPTRTDQGEGAPAPQRRPAAAAPAPRAAAARQNTGRKTSEPKGKSPPPKGR